MNKDKDLGTFFVMPSDGYESDDQRDYGSADLPPLPIFCTFVGIEVIGAAVYNPDAIVKVEFSHDK